MPHAVKGKLKVTVDGSSFRFTLHALVSGDPDGVQIQRDHCGILVNVESIFVTGLG